MKRYPLTLLLTAAYLMTAHPVVAADPTDTEALAAKAQAQAAHGDIAAARRTIAKLHPRLQPHPDYDLVVTVQALTALAAAQAKRHDAGGARRTLRRARALAPKILNIFVEMGDAPSSWAAHAYCGIAAVYGTLHDTATAKRLLRTAEQYAGGQNSMSATATDLHAVAALYRSLGDTLGAARVEHAARVAENMEGDIPSEGNRRRAEIVIRAEDGDVMGALRAARAETGENRIYVLCAVAEARARRHDVAGAHATYAEARTALGGITPPRLRDELRTIMDRNEAALPK